MASDAVQVAQEILASEQKERSALALLFSRFAAIPDRLLVQRCRMGDSISYVASVSLEWLEQRVSYAYTLPLFANKLDENKQIIVDPETISLIQQRPLDWSRQAPLAQYLAARKHHKFPPVLVVAYEGWVDNPGSDRWNGDIATEDVTVFEPLDAQGKVGLLHVPPTLSFYALDGQHRLMAVQGLMKLIKTSTLDRKKKDGNVIPNQQITLAHLEEEFGLTMSALQQRRTEEIGIEIIAAVGKSETREQARRRIRSVFVHVNRMAAPLSKSQLAQLDEDNGFAIVARHTAVHHEFLRQENRRQRVNWNSTTISGNASFFTTLQTIQDMASGFLGPNFENWKPKEAGLVPLRPEEEDLEKGEDLFRAFFDHLCLLPSIRLLDEGLETGALRRFTDERPPGQGHVLFRPVGQQAFAEGIGRIVYNRTESERQSLKDTFIRAAAWDRDGGMTAINAPSSLFYGVLYDPMKKRIIIAGRDLARRIFEYMLGRRHSAKEIAALQDAVEQARTIEDDVIDFSGKHVKRGKLVLPKPKRLTVGRGD
jgi:DGQHR domain-containing protein